MGGQSNRVWTVTTINFTAIFDDVCIAADYERWTVSDGVCYVMSDYNSLVFICVACW